MADNIAVLEISGTGAGEGVAGAEGALTAFRDYHFRGIHPRAARNPAAWVPTGSAEV